MTSTLRFVLAPQDALAPDERSFEELAMAQHSGPKGGYTLRLFSQGRRATAPLTELPFDGSLTGASRQTSDGCQLLCDATIPHFEPQHHWLGVYEAANAECSRYSCLDRFALSEANNETCWFYPTHDGSYLSWERAHRLTLQPGLVVDGLQGSESGPYERQRIALLWTLLGDDTSLSCVGLTYGGQRIDWGLNINRSEPAATWSRFQVNSQSETSLVVDESLTMFDSV